LQYYPYRFEAGECTVVFKWGGDQVDWRVRFIGCQLKDEVLVEDALEDS